MKMLKPSPTFGRNAFDESQRNVFAINFGELLPCYCLETVPHDKIEIECANLLRAQPMVTSPFLRAKQHIDFWFVPYSQLWSRWNDFITHKNEPNSSALQYAAFVPSFDLYSFLASIESSSDAQSGVGVQYDVFGRDMRLQAYRLLDLLGYPSYEYFFNATPPSPGSEPYAFVNAWRLAAYQKIWYTEYRQKYYDDGSLGMQGLSPAYMFNFDDLPCDTDSNADIFDYRYAQDSTYLWKYLCMPRYRCWKKDLFTGLMPSTQFGAVSDVTPVSTGLYNNLPNATFNSATEYIFSNSSGEVKTHRDNGPDSPLYIGSSFDILSLRRSEALQKWRENALRAGNQVEDNFEAHYGVKPKSHLDTHPILIGSIDAPVNIGDVDATAATYQDGTSQNPIINGQVGSVAGKGISSLSGTKLHFQTNDFGVVMGIMSILPEAEYMSTGIDRMNQLLEQFDYFVPEMENLGLEAVDPVTRDIKWLGQGALGYAPRYFGYKTKPDMCHLQFFNKAGAQGLLRQWCSPQQSYSNNMLRNFYVNSAVFNVNFASNASDAVPNFIVDHYTKCTAVRPMSISGMPGY